MFNTPIILGFASEINRPRMFTVSFVQNVLFSVRNFTVLDGIVIQIKKFAKLNYFP